MTITEAIKQVMRTHGSPMSSDEAYKAIVAAGLYEFHADDPAGIVRNQIRRHCEGLDFPTASTTKHFRMVGDSRYEPLEEIKKAPRKQRKRRSGALSAARQTPSSAGPLAQLQTLHTKYISDLKARILSDLKRLSPPAFEQFAKRLLDAYGFHDTKVTQVSGDGGIDGFGKLKVDLANLTVAFQCKRWTKGNIQRPEIDKFRGAAQGDVEQGLFFTTANFSDGAIQASVKRGAVPIILIDGPAIVDLMIERELGVQIESLLIPTYALDLALTTENHNDGGLTGRSSRRATAGRPGRAAP